MSIGKKRIVVILTLVMLCFVSCDFHPTAGLGTDESDYPLYSIVMVGAVGGESAGHINRIEEDDYGRVLFEFGIGNLLNSYFKGLKGYGICQKIDDEYAYYYDTYWCVFGGHNIAEDLSEEDISALKELNDWNNPLNEDAQYAKIKSYKERFDANLFNITDEETDNALTLFGKITGITEGEMQKTNENIEVRIGRSCRDSEGKTLFYVAVGDRYAQDDTVKNELYAVLINADGSATDDSILKIEDPYNCQDELAVFKEENDWCL
ncbi:MAG: hypothetical protein IJ499_06580 [Clostridia bacterium]|nr:hypothetical protein [Clostridia bacterium]